MRYLKSRRSTRLFALLAAAALVLAACGDDDDSGEDVSAGGIQSLDDLDGATIGVQSGTTGETYARENAPEGATVKDYEDEAAIFAALDANEVQAVIQDLPVNGYQAQESDAYEVVETYATGEEYGFATTPENEALIDAVNGALADIRADGTYDELFDRWIPAEWYDAGEVDDESEAGAEDDAGAEDEGDEEESDAEEFSLVTSGTLTICTDAPYEPFEFEDEDGEWTGFDMDLMREIANRLGLEMAVSVQPFEGIWLAPAAGNCDIVASAMTITEERSENALFSDGYFEADQSLLIRAEDAAEE